MRYDNTELPTPTAAPAASTHVAAPSHHVAQQVFDAHKPKRTRGLKLFDDFAYGGFLNTVVFAASVIMSYWTKHGQTFGKEGSTARAMGSWFHQRSKPVNEFYKRIGIKSESLRSDLTTVLWSFTDGTIFSFLAKPLENHREQIARKIDDTLGTTPENTKVYEAEPKQSWASIVGGRLLTSLIVVPTALVMNKIGGNQRAFLEPGRKFAGKLDKVLPNFGGWLERKTIATAEQKGDFFGYVFFEAFYTSVCTLGMYLSSRFIARRHPAKEKPHTHTAHASSHGHTDEAQEASPEVFAPSPETPRASISSPTLLERVAQPAAAAELTA